MQVSVQRAAAPSRAIAAAPAPRRVAPARQPLRVRAGADAETYVSPSSRTSKTYLDALEDFSTVSPRAPIPVPTRL